MTKRQEEIFKIILEEYVQTAQAVSSEYLSDKLEPRVSSATIRAEMVNLSNQGYLWQEHTSAGRTPTLKGFRYFVSNILPNTEKVIKSDKKKLEKVKPKNFDQLTLVKELVKEIACLSGELGVFKFEDNAFYYTGLARLFCQPEFQNTSLLQEFSQIVDDLDDSMSELLNSMGRDTQILMGEENFFGGSCSAILTRCNLPRSKDYGLIGILGPIRMNYNRNLALIESVKEIINEELIFED